MKVQDLIDLLTQYNSDEEVEIAVYETTTGHYIDATSAIGIDTTSTHRYPVLTIDVEACKFKSIT